MISTKKVPRSQMIKYTVLVLLVYLLARSFIFNDIISSSFAVGILIGMVFGVMYGTYKYKETESEIKSVTSEQK